MMKKLLIFFVALFLVCFIGQNCQRKPGYDSYTAVLAEFENPPSEFRSAPLWVWNDRVSREQIETQLADFKAHGIGGVFIHPRPGLITPYLSQEWFDLCRYAVDKGKSLGMKVWLYDENSYPSGFAGGHVPAEMPDAAGKGLQMTKTDKLQLSSDSQPFLVLRKTESGFEDITQQARAQSFPEGEFYIFELKQANPSLWYGGFTYVDIMRREVTEKFLDVTLNAYKKAIGDEFGATVPGVFQDESHILPVGARNIINFTPSLFDKFQANWGYDLRLNLPSLFEEVGDWMTVRHNFHATLLDLFIDNWAKPYYDYCTRNKLAFTGHYWEHEWPFPRLSPDNLAMAAYAHMPGIDCLMNEWRTDTHAQFGNTRAVKEIRSVANQMGRLRTMSETYGAGGWDMTFFDQKRIGDWEYVLGVNFLNQHLSYITIKGARKRDHPLSFSYHEPWWHAYSLLADYFGRLSVVMSRGQQENRILVLEPTTTAWMYYSPAAEGDRMEKIGNDFQAFVSGLEKEQVEYDLASEDILKNHGRARQKKLIVGERAYELVVLPPGLENLNQETLNLFRKFLESGGIILSSEVLPKYVDGKAKDDAAKLASEFGKNWLISKEESWATAINDVCPSGLNFKDARSISGLLFHHRRVLADAEIVFLSNSSDKETSTGRFSASGGSIEKWDPFTGKVSAYPFKRNDGRLEIDFNLPSGGSLLLCIRSEKAEEIAEPSLAFEEISPQDEIEIKPKAANVLTLDYCDLNLAGKVEKDLYFYDAQQKIFQHHGLPRNPWDSAVQFETGILDLNKFPPDSGFEATYSFSIANGVNLSSVQLVVEQPELYRVFVNGKPVEALKDKWWLDRSFGLFDIGGFVSAGRNSITLKSSPYTIFTELEPVYLLGDFMLEAQKKGFALVPGKKLALGTWDKQGMPFYAAGVSCEGTFVISSFEKEKIRYYLKLGKWNGSLAEVRVGDRAAGYIAFEPYELDITDFLAPGPNKVEVIVYGTLKNTLGPHHNNPRLGMAWPGSFQKGAEGGYAPGSEYSMVGYGLLEGFKLRALRK